MGKPKTQTTTGKLILKPNLTKKTKTISLVISVFTATLRNHEVKYRQWMY